MELFPYQKEGVADIISRDASYLGWEMGVGKSAVAIETAKKRGVKRLLILCPAVGKLTWKQELKRWWPQMKVTVIVGDTPPQKGEGVFLLAYSTLSQVSHLVDIKKNFSLAPAFDMTVLDEAHFLKNPDAIRTKAVLKELKPYLGWCLPMSGTPAPNHAGELFPILYTLFPDAVRKADGKLMRQWEFENSYCAIANRWFGGRQVRTIEGSKNLDALRAKMAPFMLRKTKKQVLKDLPEMMFDTYPISAPNAPVWGVNWKGMSDEDFQAAISQDDEHVMRMRRELGVSKVSGAADAIVNLLENCKRKALVFAIHHDVIDRLMPLLADYKPVKIDGRDNEREREKAIHAFLHDPTCRVFVGNVKAAGTSITLVGPDADVSDVFFIEADFSPGNNVQAASRIHRIGQKDAVQVWFLTAHGTYDDRLAGILARKAADFKQLFG